MLLVGVEQGMGPMASLTIVLFLLVGLHVPKAFTLLYGALLACAIQVGRSQSPGLTTRPAYWLWSLLGVLLFSVVYQAIMLYWGFASPHGSGLFDVISGLILPAGCLWVGFNLPVLGCAWATKMLLAYSLGALLYVGSALVVARHPWWAIDQMFSLEVSTPWGMPRLVNVRSIEQNGILALSLLPAALLLAIKPGFRARIGALLMGGSALLGLHTVLALNGRLGFLAFGLALLPFLPMAWHARQRWPKFLVPAVQGGSVLIGAVIWRHPSFQRVLAEGYCDERFGIYLVFFQQLNNAMLGGHHIVVSSFLCDGKTPFGLGGGISGNLTMVHDVVLDIYNDAGILPVVLLLFALVPVLAMVLRGFWRVSCKGLWDWQWSVRWSCLVVLLTQWLFQPLLYGDALLYYLSFLVLALLAAEFSFVYR